MRPRPESIDVLAKREAHPNAAPRTRLRGGRSRRPDSGGAGGNAVLLFGLIAALAASCALGGTGTGAMIAQAAVAAACIGLAVGGKLPAIAAVIALCNAPGVLAVLAVKRYRPGARHTGPLHAGVGDLGDTLDAWRAWSDVWPSILGGGFALIAAAGFGLVMFAILAPTNTGVAARHRWLIRAGLLTAMHGVSLVVIAVANAPNA